MFQPTDPSSSQICWVKWEWPILTHFSLSYTRQDFHSSHPTALMLHWSAEAYMSDGIYHLIKERQFINSHCFSCCYVLPITGPVTTGRFSYPRCAVPKPGISQTQSQTWKALNPHVSSTLFWGASSTWSNSRAPWISCHCKVWDSL